MGACIHVGGSPCRGLQSTSAKTTHCPHFIQFARLPSEQTCRPMCTLLHHTMPSPRVNHLALYWLHIPVSVCPPTRVPAIPRQRGVMVAHHADAANHTHQPARAWRERVGKTTCCARAVDTRASDCEEAASRPSVSCPLLADIGNNSAQERGLHRYHDHGRDAWRMVQYAPPCEGRSNRRGGYLICNRAPSALLQYCSTTIPNLPSLHL